MVKTYSYKRDGNTSLSPHFKVREFRSGDGADTVLIDTDLIQLLEDLRTALETRGYKVTATIINSGYRTAARDKAVGGNGKGQHTLGKAADINVRVAGPGDHVVKRGSLYCLNADLLCCVLQDLGAHGIGYMGGIAVHVDVRDGKWWGDERTHNDNVKDWYTYFRISRQAAGPPPETAPDVRYMAYAGKWWSEITNCNDRDGNGYAGAPGKAITGLKARASRGHVRYRVHTIGGRWLPWVEDYQDYAGIYGRNIDAVQMELRDAPGYALEYRVARVGGGYYSWIKGWNDKTNMGYAGSYGKAIDRIQCRVVKA